MPLKGTIDPDHMPKNLFSIRVPGISIELTAISVGSLEQELETVTLPDRVVVSGGNTRAGETDIVTPAHHRAEQDAWEAWYSEGKIQPVSPTYRKTLIVTESSNTGLNLRAWLLGGAFLKKRTPSEKDMENEGEDSRITWTVAYSTCDPI